MYSSPVCLCFLMLTHKLLNKTGILWSSKRVVTLDTFYHKLDTGKLKSVNMYLDYTLDCRVIFFQTVSGVRWCVPL